MNDTTGSISTMIGVSGGIEPIFNLSYTRKTESLHKEGDVYYKVYTPIAKEYMELHGLNEEEELPNFFVTAQTLNPHMRVKMQGVWQKHIDASISSTINLPNEATVEEVEELYMEAWKEGLKGLTIYRDGCARQGILTTKDEKEDEESHELKRGEWEVKPKGCIEIPRKIYSGCGKMTLHITIIPSEKRVFDVYVTNSAKGGCSLSIQNIAITISNLIRTGGSLQSLEKSYEGAGNCSSFARARAKGQTISKGNSCGSAILHMLLDVEKDLKNDCLEELQLLGYYDKKETMEVVKEKKEECKLSKHEIFTKEELDFVNEYGEIAFAQRFGKCPVCSEKLSYVGGCIQCGACSWSKCE